MMSKASNYAAGPFEIKTNATMVLGKIRACGFSEKSVEAFPHQGAT